MHTILSTTSSFAQEEPELLDILHQAGLRLIPNPHARKLTEDELLALVTAHAPVGILAGTEPVTRRVLEAGKATLRVVSRVGVGWDNVDRAAAAELGMRVVRTEGVLDQAVAELTLGFILSALRHIPAHDRDIRAGVWKKRMGGLLAGKTVGILGYGAIGVRVGQLVRAFGASTLFCDPGVPACTQGGEKCCLEEMLPRCHVVTLHASGKTRLLVEQLALLRPGAILVNTARAELVDEDALEQALEQGRVGAACLDVFHCEPYAGPLRARANVILTAHVGSYAREARMLMERRAVENLLAALAGER